MTRRWEIPVNPHITHSCLLHTNDHAYEIRMFVNIQFAYKNTYVYDFQHIPPLFRNKTCQMTVLQLVVCFHPNFEFTLSKKKFGMLPENCYLQGNWHEMKVIATGETTVAFLLNAMNYMRFREHRQTALNVMFVSLCWRCIMPVSDSMSESSGMW